MATPQKGGPSTPAAVSTATSSTTAVSTATSSTTLFPDDRFSREILDYLVRAGVIRRDTQIDKFWCILPDALGEVKVTKTQIVWMVGKKLKSSLQKMYNGPFTTLEMLNQRDLIGMTYSAYMLVGGLKALRVQVPYGLDLV